MTTPSLPPAFNPRRATAWLATLMLAALAACGGGGGGDDDDDRMLDAEARASIDRIVAAQMKAEGIPGTVVGVRIGEERYVTAQGLANLETGRERVADDPFRIASISKTFIGTAALLLVDRGELAKSDTVDRWYPDFPNGDRITVEHLLRMRSGIADSADQAFLEDEYWPDPLIELDAEDMIARAAARADEFIEPDTVTRYTNVNFMLLERIVERVSGTDIRSFLAANVYEPLGLRHISYPSDALMPGLLHGYGSETADGPLEDRTVVNPVPAGGAGALVSDLDDLHRYVRALCRGDLLEPASQARRLEPTTLENEPDFIGYGEGLARLGRFCGHNGTIFGFSSEAWYLPEMDATIVVSANRLDRDDRSRSFATFALITRALFPTLVDW